MNADVMVIAVESLYDMIDAILLEDIDKFDIAEEAFTTTGKVHETWTKGYKVECLALIDELKKPILSEKDELKIMWSMKKLLMEARIEISQIPERKILGWLAVGLMSIGTIGIIIAGIAAMAATFGSILFFVSAAITSFVAIIRARWKKQRIEGKILDDNNPDRPIEYTKAQLISYPGNITKQQTIAKIDQLLQICDKRLSILKEQATIDTNFSFQDMHKMQTSLMERQIEEYDEKEKAKRIAAAKKAESIGNRVFSLLHKNKNIIDAEMTA